jgi:hypothetical protein
MMLLDVLVAMLLAVLLFQVDDTRRSRHTRDETRALRLVGRR